MSDSTDNSSNRARTIANGHPQFVRWHQRILGFCLVIFAFELGVFLVVFPWLRNWEQSWVPVHMPTLARIWMSHSFRGALTGIGLLDLYIALLELVAQLRRAFHREPEARS